MPFKKGQSGTPIGRRSGQTPASKLRKAIGKHGDELVQILLSNARNGDVQAAKVLIDKLIPNLKPQSQPVKLPIDGDTLSDQGSQVLGLMANGLLPVEDASGLLIALSNLAKLKEFDSLVERLENLEQRK